MSIAAGQRITAARLNWDSDGTTLSNSTPSSTAERDWGTETITFPNPGVPVKVTAQVTGRSSTTTAGATQTTRVKVSFDGGASFTEGNAVITNALDTGASSFGRGACLASHHRSGTPTGDIVVKATAASSASTTPQAAEGFLTAQMIPQ